MCAPGTGKKKHGGCVNTNTDNSIGGLFEGVVQWMRGPELDYDITPGTSGPPPVAAPGKGILKQSGAPGGRQQQPMTFPDQGGGPPSPSSFNSTYTVDPGPSAPAARGQGGGAPFTVSVSKPLGVVLEDRPGGGVYVESMQEGGRAKASGTIQPGDVILAICGKDTSKLDVDRVMDIYDTAPPTMQLTLLRQGGAPPAQAVSSRRGGGGGGGGGQIVVQLPKPMGIVLEDRDPHGVYVQSMQDGGAALASGQIQVGDVLVSVCGQDVSALDVDSVMEVLQRAPTQLQLVFLRGGSAAPYGTMSPPQSGPRGGYYGGQPQSQMPGMYSSPQSRMQQGGAPPWPMQQGQQPYSIVGMR
mmetsp:Transcript_37400/g.86282  ORF Transcript_37400/g.86282 Transcript_37400/m.86282 type:complete len:356 (-) Transcript_37400:27-1094(-)